MPGGLVNAVGLQPVPRANVSILHTKKKKPNYQFNECPKEKPSSAEVPPREAL